MITTASSNATVVIGEANPCLDEDGEHAEFCVWPERVMAERTEGNSIVRVVAVEYAYRIDYINSGVRVMSCEIDGWTLGAFAQALCKAYTGKDLP